MNYITIKRFKSDAIIGHVNIPYGTIVQNIKGYLVYDINKPVIICSDHSQNAYDYFSRNDDEKGLERGMLIKYIKDTLSKEDKLHQYRWDKVWNDKLCQKYKRVEHKDHWLWNHDFYNATIEDLQYIANLLS